MTYFSDLAKMKELGYQTVINSELKDFEPENCCLFVRSMILRTPATYTGHSLGEHAM